MSMPVDVVARFSRLLTSLALGTLGTAKRISLGFVEPGSGWVGLLYRCLGGAPLRSGCW